MKIGEIEIKAGEQKQIKIPVAKLYTDTEISIPVHITRARKAGPTVFISAAVHGDELNGIEIIRRVTRSPSFKLTKGCLIAVPMVNIYGVLNQSRYMPDRRDLNRCFPGSPKSSLAGRLAYTFLNQIVEHCDYGIDLHTGAIHRSNLPQIRANLEDPETKLLAEAFAVPVLINANLRDGSLREAAVNKGTKILLYEAGEALRFDELSIQTGVRGILKVLSHLGMIKKRRSKKKFEPYVAYSSAWLRASASGIVNEYTRLGDHVEAGDLLADINSPFGELINQVKAQRSGIVIGKQNIPLVQEGDAMYHLAHFGAEQEEVAENIGAMQESIKLIEPAANIAENSQG
ncbi:succinylglutamate desuccinylase/aspartoacylase family protein [Agarivorans sp. QJM3NY_29]|uniref:succinylglutamate desuccinylase/aspartoacylase family protein n=1 Tax=unclassified Agarivorans TaxID=2636026 RepID=UPI003D7E96D8